MTSYLPGMKKKCENNEQPLANIFKYLDEKDKYLRKYCLNRKHKVFYGILKKLNP